MLPPQESKPFELVRRSEWGVSIFLRSSVRIVGKTRARASAATAGMDLVARASRPWTVLRAAIMGKMPMPLHAVQKPRWAAKMMTAGLFLVLSVLGFRQDDLAD
jgi:hypothetical protein